MTVLSLLRRWFNPIAAVVDQAWLSFLNFVITMAFILGATKSEYGYYIIFVTPLFLVQSIQNAIINSPLATFLPVVNDKDKSDVQKTAVSLHIYLAFVGAILGVSGLAIYQHWVGLSIDNLLLVGFSLAVIGTIAREAQRSFAYVQGQGVQALSGDMMYGATLLAGIALAFLGGQLTAGLVLLLTGIAGIVPLLARLPNFHGLQIHPDHMRQFWSCGRWALPSVIVTWISLSAYPYFAEHALGLAAVADIGAARIFLMPIGLVMTAWSNWYRPRISAWLSAGDVAATKRLTRQSLLGGWAALIVLATLIVLVYPFIEPALGEQYAGLQPLVLIWLLFFALSSTRNVYMATLMTDAQGYKILHHITWFALALSLPGFLLFSRNGALWVVGVLCVVELAQLVLVMINTSGYWKRAASGR